MKARKIIIISALTLWSTSTVAQESNEESSPRVVQIDCDGKISLFTKRILRAVQQHDLAIPTRVAIKEAFDQLDVNSDGTIVSCEGSTLAEGCDHSLQKQSPSFILADFREQEQAESQMFQCKGYLE